MISLPDRLNTRRSLRSCHHRASCNNGCRRCSTARSRSPTGAPAPTPARTRSRPSRWRLRLGATGLESDVWLTADGVPVLDHDGVVRARPAQAVGRATLRASRPARAHPDARRAARSAAASDYHLSLDLKDADAGPAVIDVVARAAPGLLPRLWLCHPRPRRAAPRCARSTTTCGWSTRPGSPG